MKSLDRKLLRELRASRGLLAAISLIITVGVMMFVYMRSTYFNLNTAQSTYYADGRMADFWIDLKKVPLAELDSLNELPGVSELRPRIQFFATVDLPQVGEPLNGLVLSLPDRRRKVINDIQMRRGSYFTERRGNEVIVNDAFARKHKIKPGNWIHLILNNRRQEMFVVGTAISCEYVYLLGPGAFVPDPEHFGVFYLKREYAEEVFDFDGAANQVVGLLSPEHAAHPEEFLQRAERKLAPFGVQAKTPRKDQASNRFLSDEIYTLGVFSNFMPAIFLAVAALILNVLMSRLVEQQRTIIGTLKAIGYGDGEIFAHFVKFGMAVGVIGGVIGCIAGYLMAEWITDMYTNYFEFPDLKNRFYPGSYLMGILISVAFALIGSLHGARAAVRLQPAEAMRPKPPESGGAIFIEKARWLWRRLSFGWRMVLRLVFRHRLRTAVGMFAAAMGSGLLVTGLMLAAAMVFLVDFQYQQIIRSDIDLSLADERSIDAVAEARGLPGVDYVEPQLVVGGTFYSGPYQRKAAIIGLAESAKLTVPHDKTGNKIIVPEVGIVLSRKLSELLHVSVGDSLTFRPTKGLRQRHTVPIAMIADGYLGMSVYADIRYLSRLIGEELAVNALQLKANPARKTRAALYRELKQLPTVQAVNSRADVIENLEKNYIEVQNIFIGMLTIFAGVIFFGSILTASIIGLSERRREVATLRVLGHTPWQIGGLFFRESLIVNVSGTILGLPLGYLLTWTLAKYYDTELFRFPIVTTPDIWIKTLALSIGFTLLAHLFVQRQVNRMDLLDALNVKE